MKKILMSIGQEIIIDIVQKNYFCLTLSKNNFSSRQSKKSFNIIVENFRSY